MGARERHGALRTAGASPPGEAGVAAPDARPRPHTAEGDSRQGLRRLERRSDRDRGRRQYAPPRRAAAHTVPVPTRAPRCFSRLVPRRVLTGPDAAPLSCPVAAHLPDTLRSVPSLPCHPPIHGEHSGAYRNGWRRNGAAGRGSSRSGSLDPISCRGRRRAWTLPRTRVAGRPPDVAPAAVKKDGPIGPPPRAQSPHASRMDGSAAA